MIELLEALSNHNAWKIAVDLICKKADLFIMSTFYTKENVLKLKLMEIQVKTGITPVETVSLDSFLNDGLTK